MGMEIEKGTTIKGNALKIRCTRKSLQVIMMQDGIEAITYNTGDDIYKIGELTVEGFKCEIRVSESDQADRDMDMEIEKGTVIKGTALKIRTVQDNLQLIMMQGKVEAIVWNTDQDVYRIGELIIEGFFSEVSIS